MEQLVQYGEVKRGVLCVNIQTLTPDIAQSMELENTQGRARVAGDRRFGGREGRPAGRRRGTAINGRPVKDAAGLRNTVGLLSVGDRVAISLLRDGKPRRVTAVIAERDAAAEARANNTHSGLEGAELTDAASGAGVLIRSVAEGSPAAQRGLRANDVIVGVGRTRVASLDEFNRATAGAAAFVLQIRRGSAMLVIPIR
jgi:S1-C subfamily serine protease